MEILNIFSNKFLSTNDESDNDQSEKDLLLLLREYWHSSKKFNLRISAVTLKYLISRLSIGASES